MNILTIPHIAGGLSHLIPLYVLEKKYLGKTSEIKNQFWVNNTAQSFLMMQGIKCVTVDSSFYENLITCNNYLMSKEYVVDMQKKVYNLVKPSLIIEDTACLTPLIAEKNKVPRISIQRTGIFRSIEKRFRNDKHVHSLQKGSASGESVSFSDLYSSDVHTSNGSDSSFLQQYAKPKVKIIPGIATIERLPEHIDDRESYFYSGPLLVKDKPSYALSKKLDEFLSTNQKKPIVFITTGTIDKTPMEKFIDFFVKRNYAVITTCNCDINEVYKQDVFYNKLLPLNYICGISNLVIHQCGSGIYHYPIMNNVPSLTIGTQCYDREDIALRLQELGVSGHIPHPDDNADFWTIFLEMVSRFEKNTLVNDDMMKKLQFEIDETTSNFEMKKVLQFALT